MYCPRCGQQQAAEEIKFCSRCGFPLGLVSEILAHGGVLPQLADLYKSKKWLTKKHGVVFSILWIIFFLLIMTPFWGINDVDALAAISAIVGLFGGLMWLIASLVLLKSEPKAPYAMNELPAANVNNLYTTNQKVLSAQQTQSAQSYVPPAGTWKAPNTGDLVYPSSVTEGTTKLLRNEEE